MKFVAGMIVMALLIGIGLLLWLPWHKPTTGLTDSHAGITIEQVQALSMLVTTRVEVADVQEVRLSGYTGSTHVAVLVKGDLLLGTDLGSAKLDNVNQEKRTATLILPKPAVRSPRLDHQRTRVFNISETGLWLIAPGGNDVSALVLERAYALGQRHVAKAGHDRGLIERSKRQAEQVLATFFGVLGWQVEVRWR